MNRANQEERAWKATWNFGGELVQRDRTQFGVRKFASREEALRWLWNKWQNWYDENDGKSFWRDVSVPTEDAGETYENDLLRLKKLREFMNTYGNGFRWSWDVSNRERLQSKPDS